MYSYCRTLDCQAGKLLFSTDGSLVNPILNYDTGSAMDASVNVVMNAKLWCLSRKNIKLDLSE